MREGAVSTQSKNPVFAGAGWDDARGSSGADDGVVEPCDLAHSSVNSESR